MKPAAKAQPDARLWERVENPSARRVLQAALESFAERGYHATTTRQIAQRAQLSPTAMYVHYRSKMDLLVIISEIGHAAVLDEVDATIADGVDHVDRVRRFVSSFTAWHARNHTLARVVQYEMHSIPADRFEPIRTLRRLTDRRLRELLEAGVAASDFLLDDVNTATLSILSLGIDVARWYDGDPEPDALAEGHAGLVMRMLGAST
jgi:AcrR family transcriptional regulator